MLHIEWERLCLHTRRNIESRKDRKRNRLGLEAGRICIVNSQHDEVKRNEQPWF